MDDSDEYFDDAFMLDEQALASIEETETRFIALTQFATPLSHSGHQKATQSASHSNRTNLKQKKPVVSRNVDPYEDDAFDLNVRVGPGGTYVIAGEGRDCENTPVTRRPIQVNQNGGEDVSVNRPSVDAKDMGAELNGLHAQLAKLRESNDHMLQSLREAQEAQLIKTGEIAMLRGTVEKQKKEYADAESKAKLERIAFEKTKAELQAKIKEETERMATSFAFRLQELETSTRKPGRSSIRAVRIPYNTQYDGTETPLRTSKPFHTSLVKETSGNGSDHEAASSSPSRALSERQRKLTKKSQFKGFKNAFTQSAPVITSPIKGDHNPFLIATAKDRTSEQETIVQNDDSMLLDNQDNVFELPVQGEAPLDTPPNEIKIDPMDEFQRILLSHLAPHCDDLTLHTLFSVSFPSDIPSNMVKIYASACNLLLETCNVATSGHSHSRQNWESSVKKIVGVFVILGNILYRAKALNHLFVLLDLLLQIVLILPSISAHFLRPLTNPLSEDLADFNLQSLVLLFRDIIQTHLAPSTDSEPFGKRHLTHSLKYNLTITILNLLGCFYWQGAEGDLEMGFSPIFKSGALYTLLLATQGQGVIKRTLQLLILCASDERMIGIFLSPHQGKPSVEDGPSEEGLMAIVNQLSVFLTDIADPELYDLLHLTFTLINALGCIHRDIRNSLLELFHLLPSVIVCITTLTRALWEEKPEIVSNLEVANSTVKLLFTAASSLHHLLFFPETFQNFSLQLMKSTGISRKYNGVVHMFIVTFGRLSWAETPAWLDSEGRALCEAVSELSMDLIEMVVPGPECDSLWSVWHESDSLEDQGSSVMRD